jgi:hypothetical protein
MAIGVAVVTEGNRRTACRNNSAPRRAVRNAPPRPSTSSRSAATAALTSSLGGRLGSRTKAKSSRAGSTSSRNRVNRTRRADSGVPSEGAIARRLSKSTRSSTRTHRPRIQLRTVARATPCSRATAATTGSRSHARATSITSTVEVGLLGCASQGSTRSRWPHPRHFAKRPRSWPAPRKRVNQVPVSLRSLEPHLAHTHPATISDVAVAIPAVYVVTSNAGTWTTYLGDRGLSARHRPRSLFLYGKGRVCFKPSGSLDCESQRARPPTGCRAAA